MTAGETMSNMCGDGQFYKITITTSNYIRWSLSMESGVNYDLYVTWDGTCPSTTNYDCRPYLDGSSSEECISPTRLSPGTYYAYVRRRSGVGSYSGIQVTLEECFNDDDCAPCWECDLGTNECVSQGNRDDGNKCVDDCTHCSNGNCVDRPAGATQECGECMACNAAGGDCVGINAPDGKDCIDDCTYCLNGVCTDRGAGATDECGDCEACDVAGGDCVGITAPDGKGCNTDCTKCEAGNCETRSFDDNVEVTQACYRCDGTNTVSQPYSAWDGHNCIDDCTYCDNGLCRNRPALSTEECPTCHACDVEGGDCIGINGVDGKNCVDDCTHCVSGFCVDRDAGATEECGTCEECNVAGGDCVGINAWEGKNCEDPCTHCVAGSCEDRDEGDATECPVGKECIGGDCAYYDYYPTYACPPGCELQAGNICICDMASGLIDETTYEIRVNQSLAPGYEVTIYNLTNLDTGEVEICGDDCCIGTCSSPEFSEIVDRDGLVTFPVLKENLTLVMEVNDTTGNTTAKFTITTDAGANLAKRIVWNFRTKSIGGFAFRKEIQLIGDEVSRTNEPVVIEFPHLGRIYNCSQLRISERRDLSIEIPYQILEEDYVTGICKLLLITSISPYRTKVLYAYYGGMNPIVSYDATWGGINLTEKRIYNDLINVTYSLDCDIGTGACIEVFEDMRTGRNWVSKGLLWDKVMVERGSYENRTIIDGPVMKCMQISYWAFEVKEVEVEVDGERLTYTKPVLQEVRRDICIYKGIPGIFETFNLESMPGETVTHELVQSSVGNTIISIEGEDRVGGSGYILGEYAFHYNQTWGQGLAWLFASPEKIIEYDFILPGVEVSLSDPYLSDLWVSQGKEEQIAIPLPDNPRLTDLDQILNYDFETIQTWAMRTPRGMRGVWYGNDNGSAEFYSKYWTTSGTSLNFDLTEEYRRTFDTIPGTTGGYGELELSFGIMRTGIHLIKFITVSEEYEPAPGEMPEIEIVSEIYEYNDSEGLGKARLICPGCEIRPALCDVTNNEFECEIDRDEKGYPLNITRQGYVINCLLYYNDRRGDYQESVMRYYHAWVHPLRWNVTFDIVVNPYARIPVPVNVTEREGQLRISLCGDWICQPGESCATCPQDCTCRPSPLQYYTNVECINRVCVPSCQPGWGNCNADWEDGCGTNLAGAHATYEANAYIAPNKTHGGWCACINPWLDCDLNLDIEGSNGCEINSDTDPNHCGDCWDACSSNGVNPTCVNGECVCDDTTCFANRADCNNDCRGDGCEVNLNDGVRIDDYTIEHCGDCGVTCHDPDQKVFCVNGVCQTAGCMDADDCGDPPTPCQYYVCEDAGTPDAECILHNHPAGYEPGDACGTDTRMCNPYCDDSTFYADPLNNPEVCNRTCDGVGNCNPSCDPPDCTYQSITTCSDRQGDIAEACDWSDPCDIACDCVVGTYCDTSYYRCCPTDYSRYGCRDKFSHCCGFAGSWECYESTAAAECQGGVWTLVDCTLGFVTTWIRFEARGNMTERYDVGYWIWQSDSTNTTTFEAYGERCECGWFERTRNEIVGTVWYEFHLWCSTNVGLYHFRKLCWDEDGENCFG
jgi:hypothetical protein